MKKTASSKIVFCLLLIIPVFLNAQSSFDLEVYQSFLESNENLTYNQIIDQHLLDEQYFTGEGTADIMGTTYLDSLIIKYEITEDELALLKKNHFVVSERMSYPSFGQAYTSLFNNDMPVFISTDAILHALHSSYDRILVSVENGILIPNLEEALRIMYNNIPQIKGEYQSNAELDSSIIDVDLYVSVAYSLITDTLHLPFYAKESKFNEVCDAISDEEYVEMPLFTVTCRKLDFSQFTVRGHYTETKKLSNYFKAMMWLGRIDFLLTNLQYEPHKFPKEDIQRMNISAFMLNELLDISETRNTLKKNDEIISFFIGEDDNINPNEYDLLLDSLEISTASQLVDSLTLYTLQNRMQENNQYGQRILSNFIIVDPYSATPDTLPISFRLMGQKFIIDSYILSNVVYDRVIFQDKKIKRMMPKTLDILFALGNNDALYFLKEELERYHYASQLNSLRYLIDKYDDEFWEESLYNLWLNSIRKLNSGNDTTGFPGFMKTSAWRQEKMNTQLASWSQLRHDNLLYAKQSYTGGTECSFPQSYVEPYPEFYKAIGNFAENANLFFTEIPGEYGEMTSVNEYFTNLQEAMFTLESIARKQLKNEEITLAEDEFLKSMIIANGIICGNPLYSGWYINLFYDLDKSLEPDYIIADVHTQPTDELGDIVGKVLHVGTGKVNLGVFLAKSNKTGEQVAFSGPVFSYYEKTTYNFDRLTDEMWADSVFNSIVPERLDWCNVYLANEQGLIKNETIELPYKRGNFTSDIEIDKYSGLKLNCFPNPANNILTINYRINQPGSITITIFDVSGRNVVTSIQHQEGINVNGEKILDIGHLDKGIYFVELATNKERITKRIIVE